MASDIVEAGIHENSAMDGCRSEYEPGVVVAECQRESARLEQQPGTLTAGLRADLQRGWLDRLSAALEIFA